MDLKDSDLQENGIKRFHRYIQPQKEITYTMHTLYTTAREFPRLPDHGRKSGSSQRSVQPHIILDRLDVTTPCPKTFDEGTRTSTLRCQEVGMK